MRGRKPPSSPASSSSSERSREHAPPDVGSEDARRAPLRQGALPRCARPAGVRESSRAVHVRLDAADRCRSPSPVRAVQAVVRVEARLPVRGMFAGSEAVSVKLTFRARDAAHAREILDAVEPLGRCSPAVRSPRRGRSSSSRCCATCRPPERSRRSAADATAASCRPAACPSWSAVTSGSSSGSARSRGRGGRRAAGGSSSGPGRRNPSIPANNRELLADPLR